MNTSKALIIASFAILAFSVPMANANAFTLFGFDLGEFWDNLVGNEKVEEKETQDNASEKKNLLLNTSKNSNQDTQKRLARHYQQKSQSAAPVEKRNAQRNVTIYDGVYTEGFFKSLFNNNEQVRSYVQGFGYECLAIQTDKGTQFTLYFRETGGLEKMRLKLDCEHQVELEESLVQDLRDDGGFRAGNIKTYLDKVDIPTGMYFKAIKVFAIG